MAETRLYDLLGVSSNASDTEIKKVCSVKLFTQFCLA